MKGFRVLTILCGAVLLITCQEEAQQASKNNILSDIEHPPVKNLSYQVIAGQDMSPGGGIKLMWEKPDSAEPDDYVVSVDGVDLVPIMEPYMDVYEPGAELSVYARYSGVKSEPVTVNFGAVETPNLEVWSITDPSPNHPCGFGFDSTGMAIAYKVYEAYLYDYWIYADPDRILLVSPSDHAPDPFNEHYYYSTIASETYSNLDTIDISNSLIFSTQSKIYVDTLYSLWLSEDMSGYSVQDHFAKVLVTGIENSSEIYKISFKLAYQLIPGLRWVVVENNSSGIDE